MAGDYGHFLLKFLRRGLVALVMLVIGLLYAPPMALPIFLLAAAILVVSPLASMAGEFFGNLLLPRHTFDRPVPLYGIAEARRRENRPEEAILQYRSITQTHPEETKPWLAMMEIAVVELGDPARALSIRDEALVRFARSAAREGFVQLSSQILTRSARPRSSGTG